jgi:NAD(P)-dependent dehydrogenase (short-subunit alcohol dehydrogenase family)
MEIKLTGKRALVTGANSGIGEVIALALADAGARVAVNYVVNPEAAQAVAGKVRGKSGDALTLHADVGNADQVTQMFDEVDSAWGGLDVVVNNAGIVGPRAYGWESNPTAWRQVIEINLLGAFHCSREALRRMVPRKSGVILNLTSVARGDPLVRLQRLHGREGRRLDADQDTRPRGGAARCARPRHRAGRHPDADQSGGVERPPGPLLRKIPMGRLGQREEIAQMAVFLVSDAASYVTGTTVFVDGGMTNYADFAHGG